jgi:hypothetical protein
MTTPRNNFNALPDVGLKCRGQKNHQWSDPVNSGKEILDDGSYYYYDYVCLRECGTERRRRLDRWGRFMSSETTRMKYQPGYQQKGGVDELALGAYRLAQEGFKAPKTLPPDVAAKKEAETQAEQKRATARKTAAKRSSARKVTKADARQKGRSGVQHRRSA